MAKSYPVLAQLVSEGLNSVETQLVQVYRGETC